MPPLNGEDEEQDLSLREELEESFDDDYAAQGGLFEEDLEQHQEVNQAAGQQDQQQGQQEASPIEPPARWTKEEKEQFAALDPNVQRILMGRNKGLEADYTRKMTEIAQERARFKGIESELASRRQHWSRTGMSDTDAVRSIMSYWDLLQQDPVKFLGTIAQERGIDLAAAFGPSPEEISQLVSAYTGEVPYGNGQGGQVNPLVQRELQQLRAQQQQLQQTIQQQQQAMTQRQQAELQQTVQSAQAHMDEFSQSVDSNGQPLYPFFQEVRKDMAVLMRNGRANDLHQAYSIAVRMNDNAWNKIQESQEIARRRADDARRKDEVARARRAGASVSTGTTPAASYAQPEEDDNMSIRDLLKQQFQAAQVGGRI